MKNKFVKSLTGVLMAAIICSLAGCGGNSADQPGQESSVQESQTGQETGDNQNTQTGQGTQDAQESQSAEESQPASEDGNQAQAGSGHNGEQSKDSPGQILLKEFTGQLEENAEMSAEAMADALIGHEIIPFAGATMQVEPGYLNGFQSEITGFTTGYTFGPMIGTIPFVGYIFELDEQADVDAFKQSLRDNADLRWNVCTQADELVCDSVGNKVFFVMSPAKFAE